MDCPTLSGDFRAEGLPSPKEFPWNLQLPGSEEGGKDHPGHGSPEMLGLIGNTPRSTLWSRAGASLVSCPPP